jgi:SepF-like predicted cell division protein (DUF552 family)
MIFQVFGDVEEIDEVRTYAVEGNFVILTVSELSKIKDLDAEVPNFCID